MDGNLDFSIDMTSELNSSLLDRDEAKLLSKGVSEAIKRSLVIDDSVSNSVVNAKSSSESVLTDESSTKYLSQQPSPAKVAATIPTPQRQRGRLPSSSTPSPFGKQPIRHLQTPMDAGGRTPRFDPTTRTLEEEGEDSDASMTMADLHALHARQAQSGAPYYLSDDEAVIAPMPTDNEDSLILACSDDAVSPLGDAGISPIKGGDFSPARASNFQDVPYSPFTITPKASSKAASNRTPGLSPIVVAGSDDDGDDNTCDFDDSVISSQKGKLRRSLSLEFDSAQKEGARGGDERTVDTPQLLSPLSFNASTPVSARGSKSQRRSGRRAAAQDLSELQSNTSWRTEFGKRANRLLERVVCRAARSPRRLEAMRCGRRR